MVQPEERMDDEAGTSNPIAEAILRWQRGIEREESFRRIVETFYPLLHRFFLRCGCGGEEARDLTQETFIRVYKGLGRFRREARFETWLFQIATNLYRNALRHKETRKRAPELPATSLPEPPAEAPELADPAAEAPLDRVLAKERQHRLRQAIAQLPPQMRTTLALRIDQELSYREIAAVMKLSVETVKAHLLQARRRLRQTLAPSGQGPLEDPSDETP